MVDRTKTIAFRRRRKLKWKQKDVVSANKPKRLRNLLEVNRKKDGLQPTCKSCCSLAHKKWWREKGLSYYDKNKERIQLSIKKYYKKNTRRVLKMVRNWNENNKERVVKCNAERFQKNKERLVKRIIALQIKRYHENPRDRLLHLLRSRMGRILKAIKVKKTIRTLDLLGCTLDDLKVHLEKQFREGMIWENQGKVWEVDHVKPCARFDLTKEEEQKVCFHYSNLQPLFKYENRKKSNSWKQ